MRLTILLLVFLCCCSRLYADESPVSPRMDEVNSVDSIDTSIEQRNRLDDDPSRRSIFPDFFNRFRAYREELNKKIRLEALFSYNALTQGYAGNGRSEGATSDEVSATFRWLLFGHKSSRPVYLSFSMRHRHAYGDTAPSQLSSRTGLLWGTVYGFTDAGFQIPELYISQELADSRLTLRYGQFSIDDFFDNNKLRSAKRYFLNQAFSANPTVAFPDYGAGFTAQWKDTGNWDLSVGASNIQALDQSGDINLDFSSTAIFYIAQGGYNFTGYAGRDARAQLMAWSSQDNNEEALENGNGVSLTLEQAGAPSGERYLVRLAYSDADTAPVDQLLTLGWGRPFRKYDHLGLGLGLGRSAADSSRYQGVAEAYYRWQVTKELLITPDLQIIAGKGTDDGEDFQIVVGLRGGFTF